MHMKKIIALLSVLALTLLASCGKAEETTEETTATGVEVEATVDTVDTMVETATGTEVESTEVVTEEELTEEAVEVEMN